VSGGSSTSESFESSGSLDGVDTAGVSDPSDSGQRPSPDLFEEVVGQAGAVSQLISAARRPVHAYLLHGPPGSGKRAAARALAAALLCPNGGCNHCNTCRRALAGTHPDLVVVERTGASVDVDEARSIVTRAQRRPLEAARQILVVADVHLADKAAPALLKTVEEPPPATVFVLLADELTPGLVTIASRCVKINFGPVSHADVVAWLVARDVSPDHADSVARASGGRLDRARLLVGDPGFVARQQQWKAVPSRLDGTGAAAASVASELIAAADQALAPLRDQHAQELVALEEQAEMTGAKGIPGRKQVEDSHRREERRWRTDDLRFGLATLATIYRDRLVATATATAGVQGCADTHGTSAEARRAVHQVDALRQASVALGRNANEVLTMDALMVELSGMLD
jgi:DNA polymerase-3 subunit delta'